MNINLDIEKLVSALRFYATKENYLRVHNDPETNEMWSVIDYDEGIAARRALSNLGGKALRRLFEKMEDGESHCDELPDPNHYDHVHEPEDFKMVTSFAHEVASIIEELSDTLMAKNSDYGNSFSKQYRKRGLVSAIIRMEDKLNRLDELQQSERQVKDETVLNTVLDLAGYAILTAIELKREDSE